MPQGLDEAAGQADAIADSPTIFLAVEHPRNGGKVVTDPALIVQGVAYSPEGIVEVSVRVGSLNRKARLGVARPDLAQAYPDAAGVGDCGFVCRLFHRSVMEAVADLSNPVTLAVTARSKNGEESSQEVLITLDLPVAAPVSEAASADDPPMLLQIDRAAIDRKGVLAVTGWAVCHSPVETINVFAGARSLGSAELGIQRLDVANAWPRFASAVNSGFTFVTDGSELAGTEDTIKVVAQAVGGLTRDATIALQSPDYVARRKEKEKVEFFCDSAILTNAGELLLSGWSVASAGIEKITVDFEGTAIGQVEYGHERPDVGNKFPMMPGSRNSGFRFEGQVEKSRLKNEHVIRVEITLKNGATEDSRISVATVEATAAPASAHEPGVLLNIDQPQIVNGAAIRRIDGTLSINGWSIAQDGISSIEFELDQRQIGKAYLGIRREDVAKAFPTYPDALLCGFSFSVPPRALSEGPHSITVKVHTKAGHLKEEKFGIEVAEIAEQAGPWSLRTGVPLSEQLLMWQVAGRLGFAPHFHVWIDCNAKTTKDLPVTLRGLREQLYKDWSVVISGEPKAKAEIEAAVARELGSHGRKVTVLPGNDEAAALIEGSRTRDLVLPLDAGDCLGVDALFEFASELNASEATDFIYADERRRNPAIDRTEAFFKPDWSPTLALSANYIGRPWCATVELMRRSKLRLFVHASAANYDLVLKLTEQAERIRHVQRVLAERNPAAGEPVKAEIQALKAALKRRHLNWAVEGGRVDGTFRCRPKSTPEALVSIIIPTCATRGLIKTCIETLRNVSTYKHIEIICIDNILDETSEWKEWLRTNSDVVVEILEPFNWSRFNNLAAREASGSYFLFLNDDIEVIQPGWLEALLDLAQRKDVAAAGPQLLYPDRKVQHAGMFLAGNAKARHSFRFAAEDEPGYFGLALTQRNVIAITGACMLVRREVFEELGGFDEAHSVVNNDLDFCLKAHAHGLQCVFTPFATLIHHELVSRKDLKDEHDVSGFNARWGNLFAMGDPYFHPNLETTSDDYQIDSEPAQLVFAGRPLFRKESIKRILAVKLDHIGDFVTAFPAFQRIKEQFPDAELIGLVAPASRALARLEPSLDRIIPYQFFHAVSQRGAVETDEAELARLKAELAALQIDIAIDLRLHTDTRNFLQHAGARFTAGFDHRSQFPWLDIALSWEGDTELTQKHHHVSDTMIQLVDAVAAAATTERSVFKRPADWSAQQLPLISRLTARGMFSKPLICIHPATGNEMRQWPAHRFAELIGALLASEDVDICIVGGPDELELANKILDYLPEPDRIHNLVGTMKLIELAYLFDAAALFIGNNSGPKHIAATMGTPTIGIHSGVVDAREWGPLGDAAVAVQRSMSCGPCYKATRDQCHRGIACLNGLTTSIMLSHCRRMLQLQRGIRVAT